MSVDSDTHTNALLVCPVLLHVGTTHASVLFPLVPPPGPSCWFRQLHHHWDSYPEVSNVPFSAHIRPYTFNYVCVSMFVTESL